MKNVNILNIVKFFICVIIGIAVTKMFNNIFVLILIALIVGFVMEKIKL